ncbi:MAG TPA: methyltransferase domain-containing protein [Verrucomicrobiae bacterium]|nr:methyltransferase domain-containing protein [Verrucomicrobiae bacterium]
MLRKYQNSFVCLKCGAPLGMGRVAAEDAASEEIREGELVCTNCSAKYPIVRGLPRFVAEESYAHSFGFQWNRFDQLQLDTAMNNDLSRDRFYATTGWPPRMEGQRILEAGCGMGRFTQLSLETGAEVFSFDLSLAVEAAVRNNSGSPRLCCFQASIYEIPIARSSFDRIFCMGVLQHCPDVRAAFDSLVPFLKPGGEIVIDVYEKTSGIPPLKYMGRPFLKHWKPESIHRLLRWTIPPAFEVKKAVHRIPVAGPRVARLIPIGPLSHAPRLNYTDEQLKEVKILSALDMLSPVYDQPQRLEEVRVWLEEAGLTSIEMKRGYNGINAKGRRPL